MQPKTLFIFKSRQKMLLFFFIIIQQYFCWKGRYINKAAMVISLVKFGNTFTFPVKESLLCKSTELNAMCNNMSFVWVGIYTALITQNGHKHKREKVNYEILSFTHKTTSYS